MAFVYTYGVGPTGYTDGTTTSGWQPQNFAYGGRITFAEAGDVDQLGLYGNAQGSTNTAKIALYDTSGNLVADGGSFSVTTTAQWHDCTAFTPVAVSAADYVILSSAANAFIVYGYDSANDGSYASRAYASFPTDPETLNLEAESGLGYGRRANFTAGGGAQNINATGHAVDVAFGAPTVAKATPQNVAATGLGVSAAFGTASVVNATPQGINTTGLAVLTAFGTPTVGLAVQNIDATGLGVSAAFGSAVVTNASPQNIPVTGLAVSPAFGSAVVANVAAQTITPTGVTVSTAFGTAELAIIGNLQILPSGIAVVTAYGDPAVTNATPQSIIASGLGVVPAFGTAAVTNATAQGITVNGLAVTVAFGNTQVFLESAPPVITVGGQNRYVLIGMVGGRRR